MFKKLFGFIRWDKQPHITGKGSYKLSDDEIRRLKMLYPSKDENFIEKLVKRIAKLFSIR